MVSKRCAKANIMYLNSNNLYGWAISKSLPKSGFRWKQVMPNEEEIMKKKEGARTGFILEVGLEYPAEPHEEHNSYPLAPEQKYR